MLQFITELHLSCVSDWGQRREVTMLDNQDLRDVHAYPLEPSVSQVLTNQTSCYFALYKFNLPTLVSLNTHASLSSLSCVGSEK